MDVDKKYELSKLLDCYENLLTPYQQQLCALHNDNDLSLAELSEEFGVSRQAVQNTIARATQQLYDYESRLHFADKCDKIFKLLDELMASDYSDKTVLIAGKIKKILED